MNKKIIIFICAVIVLLLAMAFTPKAAAEQYEVVPVYEQENYPDFETWCNAIMAAREDAYLLEEQSWKLDRYISENDREILNSNFEQMKNTSSMVQYSLLLEETTNIIEGASDESQLPQNRVVDIALSYLGTPYVWGGESPSGFDCSGLVKYCYAQIGINISHYTGSQYREGMPVSIDDLQPGDLVFFGRSIHHVGMYIGDGLFIHAPQTGDVVKITSLSSRSDFIGARRYV